MDIQKERNKLIDEMSNELISKQKEIDGLLDKLNEQVKSNFEKEFQIETLEGALKNCKVTLERYENENKALRELVRLWV